MTNNNSFAKSRKRIFGILLLSLVFLLSLCCSFACSCNEDEPASDDYDPSFSYSDIIEDETILVSNGNFTLGLAEKDKDDYPVSSMTGWSLSTDTSAVSSAVTSGVINTTADTWKTTVEGLVAKKPFLEWAKAKYSITPADGATNAQIADLLINAGFTAPERTGGDGNVLMINNYTDNDTYATNLGTAQSVKSSSTVSLEKGKALKVTFFAKTDAKMSSLGSAFGANLRVDSTINSVTQAQYAIKNINTNGEWKEFTLYVRGNDNVATSVTFSFGLGFYSLEETQLVTGSAYFDDLKVEEITATAYDSARENQPTPIYEQKYSSLSSTTFNGDPEQYREGGPGRQLFFYSLADKIETYVSDALTASDYDGFASGLDASKIAHFDVNGSVTVNKQVAGLKVNALNVPANSYSIVRFTIKNNLSKYYADGVKIFLLDKNVTTGDVLGAKNPLTSEVFTDIDKDNNADETTYTITVVNSFPAGGDDRSFELLFIVGPQNPVEQTSTTYFPTGTVEIKNFKQKTAPINALDNISGDAQYKFINSLSNGTFSNYLTYSLYAGEDAVYSEDTETESYNVTVSGLNKTEIQKGQVVNPAQYSATKTADGTVAGVINSKYTYSALPNADFGTLDKDEKGKDINIQPLVIYNPTASAYGFVGEKKTISANTTAQITLKVKVDDDAKANIYIVNMSNGTEQLKVLTHTVGETSNALAISVADTDGKWVTVTFNIASGATALNYRVEMWNGARSNETEGLSAGYVYFNEINYSTFTEPSRLTDRLLNGGNALADASVAGYIDANNTTGWLTHTRELTPKEVEFNSEYPDKAISYSEKYVWVKGNNFVYAIYNTIDPVATDPYANIESDETEEEVEDTGCAAKFDPATFWLQFSTILLAVVLALAVVLLIIKTIRRNHKKSVKVKSRYTVRSRNFASRRYEKPTTPTAEPSEEPIEEPASEEVSEEETTDETEYVYDEVIEDFGETVIDGQEVELPTEEVVDAQEEVNETPAEEVETPTETSEENKD